MKIGILGYGAWGHIHSEVIESLERHELAAVACKSEESAEEARRDHPGALVSIDYNEIIERRDIDCIDVVLPTYLHVPAAIAALETGKHVLLEKPPAPGLEDAGRLLDAVSRSGKSLSLVHELRCSDQWAGIKHRIADGEIGLPRYGLFNLFRFPYRSGKEGWRYEQEKVGSWVLEEPIHFIDLMLWYFADAGKPQAVTAFGNTGENGLTRDFTAVFDFPGGAYGIVTQTLAGFEHHQVVEITGEKGAIRSLWSGAMDRTDHPEFSVAYKSHESEDPDYEDLTGPSGELFEIRRYISSALDKLEENVSLYPMEQEFELMKLCLFAEESLRMGKRIVLQ
jgi:myo-inositol 2-dehydrogenase / D-chiro-inositol 1-dehydrogenase